MSELHIIQGRRTFPFFRSHFFSWALFLFAFTGVQYSDSGYRLGLGKWRLTKKGKQHSSLVFGYVFLSFCLAVFLTSFLSLSLSFFLNLFFFLLLTYFCLLACFASYTIWPCFILKVTGPFNDSRDRDQKESSLWQCLALISADTHS